MKASDNSNLCERNRRASKPRMSLKDRRSFSSDMSIDLSAAKNSNMFFTNNPLATTPSLKQTPFNGPVNTPYQLDSVHESNISILYGNCDSGTNGSSQTDIIMESEEERNDFSVPPFLRPPSNFGSPKRLNQKRESNGILLSGEIIHSTNSEDTAQYLSPPANKTQGSSSNTTPLETKFRFGNHSRSSSGSSSYQKNLENHKQHADNIKGSFGIIGRTSSLNSSLDFSAVQKNSTNTNKTLHSNLSNTNNMSSTLHKHSSSSGFDKSKMKRKHKHNLSLPQANLITTSSKYSSGNSHRVFGENFFKINVQYQETLSPLLDSVNSEELKRMNAVKKYHEHRHEGANDICTENLKIFDSDTKEAFFQKRYKLFKEKELERNINGDISLVPNWLDFLLNSKEKLYFITRFQELSYLERERIDQYFLYQKNLFENSTRSSTSTASSIESVNSELFSGDVFENGIKNRYKSVIPYQKTRVILQENAKSQPCSNNSVSQGNSTYFNGNYLSTPFQLGENPQGIYPYIATQAPLEHTIRDFFNVLISNNVRMVLTLTKEIENGMNKCSNFWRDNKEYNGIHCSLVDEYRINEEHTNDCLFKDKKISECFQKGEKNDQRHISSTHKDVSTYFQESLSNESRSHLTYDIEDSLIIRLLKLSWLDVKTGEPKEWVFMQVQMTTWPDFGVPSCNCDLLNVLNMKMIVQELTKVGDGEDNSKNGKILVHCSSGSGRSGAICCADSLIEIMLNKERCINSIDPVYDIVASFREQRLHMVQNVNQYMMIYDCLISFLQSQIDGSWENFKQKNLDLSIFTKFRQMIK